MKAKETYDVIVIGSGLAGSMLALILARNDAEVLMLERSSHPRFAIGESLLPQATVQLWMLGERYGIPEIQYLSC